MKRILYIGRVLRQTFLATAKVAVCGIVLSALFGALPAFAAPATKTYRIDTAHTRVVFSVNHLGLSKFPGIFNGVSGNIEFNFSDPQSSVVDVSIDATKLSMGQAALDAKLQGKDYFNTAKFPVITFKSTSIRKDSISHGRITGDLTLLGVTKKVTLDVTFNGRKWNRFANAEFAGFSAKTKIRRSDFGLKTLLPDIGDEVDIVIEVEAREARPAMFTQ